jgi:hypothetical protein
MTSDAPEPDRHVPPVSVEAAEEGAAGDPAWAGSVVMRTERHRCGHRLWFQHLNTAGRVRAVGGMAALAVSWTVIVFGCLVGIGLAIDGTVHGSPRSGLIGLLLVVGTVLQLFGAVAFASVWRRPHRPHDAVLVAAAVGFLVFLTAAVLLVVVADLYVAPLFAVPFAVVLWQLFWFRQVLYGRGSCRSFPGYAPAVRAMLEHDPGPYAVLPEPVRFRLEQCPHRLPFGELRRSAQVMSVVNTVLLLAYFAVLLWLMFVLVSRPEFGRAGPGHEAVAYLAAGTIMLLNMPGFQELKARSQRYHRAAVGFYPAAFAGYALTAAVGFWSAVVLGGPATLVVTLLAAYWAYSAWVALTRLPPRSACGAMQAPPPVVQKMLKPGVEAAGLSDIGLSRERISRSRGGRARALRGWGLEIQEPHSLEEPQCPCPPPRS